MSSNMLKGVLGWKGERGYSAYEIACMNGFIGSEKDWLARVGTTSTFKRECRVYTATENQKSFDLPSNYTSDSFVDVYINGLRLNANEYKLDTTAWKINLVGIVLDAGAVVEIVSLIHI